LLDPPCSALGLRPKLQIVQNSIIELQAFATYQQAFVRQAILLLKPGGSMTYSTCTIHSMENEGIVRYILDEYESSMELVPIDIPFGLPGLPDVGLTDEQRNCVRRFDPSDTELDTMGFFVAKFRKKENLTN
jgi:methyltransferase NSUN6